MEKRRPANILLEVGSRLRITREALDLTQIDFCGQINVATNTYNQWEKGKSLLDPLAACRLVRLHGVTLDYLYLGDVSGLPHHLVHKIFGRTSPLSDPAADITKAG